MKAAEYRTYPSTMRPASEVLRARQSQLSEHSAYEDLQRYERCLEDMAAVTLDQSFKEELQHVNQWFCYLSDAERTATIYTLLQHSTPVQTRFFMNLLQQQKKRDSVMTLSDPDPTPFQQAEKEASQWLMNVLPYKTGQAPTSTSGSGNKLASSHPASRSTPAFDRHSVALGDMDDPVGLGGANLYSHQFAGSGSQLSVPRPSGTHSTSLTSPRTATFPRSTHSRPSSGVDMDSPDFFSAWRSSQQQRPSPNANHNNNNSAMVGSIGDRASSVIERPKSADLFGDRNSSTTSLASHHHFQPWTTPSAAGDLAPYSDKPLPRIATLAEKEEEDDDEFYAYRAPQYVPAQRPPQNSAQLSPAAAFAQYYSAQNTSPVPSLSTPASYGQTSRTKQNNSNKLHHTHTQQYGTYLAPHDAFGDDAMSDHSEASSYKSHSSRKKYTKYHGNKHHNKKDTKKNNDNVVNMDILTDIPAWLRSLRLHKYTPNFETMRWQDIVKLDEQQLEDKGVSALGARRKMLKVFENIKHHCETNNIPI
ncbi:hypothetical protein BC940DRAFT_345293 [Gongronella butleri]|nr:hypothetical protein BC940DRAFT_345293 [Gongronella butleri]